MDMDSIFKLLFLLLPFSFMISSCEEECTTCDQQFSYANATIRLDGEVVELKSGGNEFLTDAYGVVNLNSWLDIDRSNVSLDFGFYDAESEFKSVRIFFEIDTSNPATGEVYYPVFSRPSIEIIKGDISYSTSDYSDFSDDVRTIYGTSVLPLIFDKIESAKDFLGLDHIVGSFSFDFEASDGTHTFSIDFDILETQIISAGDWGDGGNEGGEAKKGRVSFYRHKDLPCWPIIDAISFESGSADIRNTWESNDLCESAYASWWLDPGTYTFQVRSCDRTYENIIIMREGSCIVHIVTETSKNGDNLGS